MNFSVPANAVMHRLYGPFYLHFNAFSATNPNVASLYQEALAASAALQPSYDTETELLQNGYAPSFTRGNVQVRVSGLPFRSPLQSWVVLSDPATNFQYSHASTEYWDNPNPVGFANVTGVAPGTYRLSTYLLGQWGELRHDGVSVAKGPPTKLNVQFTPENFGTDPPIWTIGTPDRSSHEFLHGQITNPIDLDPAYTDQYTALFGTSTQDDREYWGNWNYWADFAANNGAVVYYATPVGSIPATNDLSQWNYNQWHIFDPGLYAGVFNPADQTTDGYDYICPSYVGGPSLPLTLAQPRLFPTGRFTSPPPPTSRHRGQTSSSPSGWPQLNPASPSRSTAIRSSGTASTSRMPTPVFAAASREPTSGRSSSGLRAN